MNTLTLKVPLYAVGQASTAVWDGDFGSVDSFRTFFLSPQNMDVKNAPNDKLIIHQPPRNPREAEIFINKSKKRSSDAVFRPLKVEHILLGYT